MTTAPIRTPDQTRTPDQQKRLDLDAAIARAGAEVLGHQATIQRLEIRKVRLPSVDQLPTDAAIRTELQEALDLARKEEAAAQLEADAARASLAAMDAADAARLTFEREAEEASRAKALEARRAELRAELDALTRLEAEAGPIARDAGKALSSLFAVHMRAQTVDWRYRETHQRAEQIAREIGVEMPQTSTSLALMGNEASRAESYRLCAEELGHHLPVPSYFDREAVPKLAAVLMSEKGMSHQDALQKAYALVTSDENQVRLRSCKARLAAQAAAKNTGA